MDEKCGILRAIGGKYYATLDECDGEACLNVWTKKTKGEFGSLTQTSYEEELY